MNSENTIQDLPIISWNCGCRAESGNIALSRRSCPYCKAPMPRNVRTQVYRQVHREIHTDILETSAQRWLSYANVSLKIRPGLRLFMFLLAAAWAVGIILVLPEFFPSIPERLAILPASLSRQLSGRIPKAALQPILEKLQTFPLETLLDKGLSLLSVTIAGVRLLVERVLDLVQLVTSYVRSFLS